MNTVENGAYVRVAYTGSLQNGEIFDTSRGREPMEVHMGAGKMIPGFEKALLGMTLSEKKTFTLDADQAYGARDDNLHRDFPRSDVPDQLDPEVGQVLALMSPQGQQFPAKIVHVDDEKITFDLNHPLAGEALTFEVQVVGISATPTRTPEGCGCGCSGDCSSGCC